VAILLEVCIDDEAGLERALAGGAGRLEICARLDLGGTTPAPALLEAAIARAAVPCFAMVRPRGGDFVYAAAEIEALEHDLARVRRLGAHGVVLGALTARREIDRDLTRHLVELARPLPVTFHRAFDEARDLETALETLIELGVERVLTAGGAADAFAGRDRLRALVEQARGRIEILAGGGIRAHNASAILAASGVCEIHSSTVFAPPRACASLARGTGSEPEREAESEVRDLVLVELPVRREAVVRLEHHADAA
jgi:copper homeostasis protein